MRTTIDRAGRLVIPKALRDRLQLADGAEVDVDERDGLIEVRPVPAAVRIVETDDGPVAQPIEDMPVLTDAMVRETLDRVRR
jgi:AbrB family looped-hinge helix DNA binding protein